MILFFYSIVFYRDIIGGIQMDFYLKVIGLLAGMLIALVISSLIGGLFSLALFKAMGYNIGYIKFLWLSSEVREGKRYWYIGTFSPIFQISRSKENETEKEDMTTAAASYGFNTLMCIVCSIVMLWAVLHKEMMPSMVKWLLIGAAAYLILSWILRTVIFIKVVPNAKNSLSYYTRQQLERLKVGIPLDELVLPPYKELDLPAIGSEIVSYDCVRFIYLVWTKQYDKLREVVSELEKELYIGDGKAYVKAYTGGYYDLIFYYSCFDRSPFNAKYYFDIVEKDLINDRDANGKRVLAFYYYYNFNDIPTAEKYISEAYDMLPNFSVYLQEREYERMLLDKISETISKAKSNGMV